MHFLIFFHFFSFLFLFLFCLFKAPSKGFNWNPVSPTLKVKSADHMLKTQTILNCGFF